MSAIAVPLPQPRRTAATALWAFADRRRRARRRPRRDHRLRARAARADRRPPRVDRRGDARQRRRRLRRAARHRPLERPPRAAPRSSSAARVVAAGGLVSIALGHRELLLRARARRRDRVHRPQLRQHRAPRARGRALRGRPSRRRDRRAGGRDARRRPRRHRRRRRADRRLARRRCSRSGRSRCRCSRSRRSPGSAALPRPWRTPRRSRATAPPLRLLAEVLRRDGARQVLVAQVLWVASYAALVPFMVLYAEEVLGLRASAAGVLLAGFGCSPAWGCSPARACPADRLRTTLMAGIGAARRRPARRHRGLDCGPGGDPVRRRRARRRPRQRRRLPVLHALRSGRAGGPLRGRLLLGARHRLHRRAAGGGAADRRHRLISRAARDGGARPRRARAAGARRAPPRGRAGARRRSGGWRP